MHRGTEELEQSIAQRMGFFPPFFAPARGDVYVLTELWNHTVSAYLDNPLPALFKEKLTALLSRHCVVPYCVMCHSAALRPLGFEGEQVLDLVDGENAFLASRAAGPAFEKPAWPKPGSEEEKWLLDCSEAVFLHIDWERGQDTLRQAVGAHGFYCILLLTSYVRACADWASAHPDLRSQDDPRVQLHLAPLVGQEPKLSAFFRGHATDGGSRAVRWIGEENAQLLTRLQASNANLQRDVQSLEEQRGMRERFVSALSHDLRAPIAVALMSAQLIARRAHDSAYVSRVSKRIESSMMRADRMIRDLLDANQMQAGQDLGLSLKPTQLDDLLVQAVSDLNELYDGRVAFNNAAGAVQGDWDPEALRRVVDNLVSNAVKYGAQGTQVTLSLLRDREGVELRVHNQGDAIPCEDQGKLFLPYARTQTAVNSGQQGWGIGLALVKKIATQHGGQVCVESSEPQGTTFIVRMPVRQAVAPGSD